MLAEKCKMQYWEKLSAAERKVRNEKMGYTSNQSYQEKGHSKEVHWGQEILNDKHKKQTAKEKRLFEHLEQCAQ